MKIAIGLGSSLGDRRRTLELALLQLHHTPGLRLLRASRWYRSAPMRGGVARGWFLNGVALLESDLHPHEVLDRCRALEQRAGRRRSQHWADRTLDLDVLVVERFTCRHPDLVLPHPGIADRPFVWWPLHEVWPDAPLPQGPPPPRHAIVAVGAFARRAAML